MERSDYRTVTAVAMTAGTLAANPLETAMRHGSPHHFLIALLFVTGLAADEVRPQPKLPGIEVAILIDTSSSMDGLIDQARAQLWATVNQLAATTRDGRSPSLRVALYEYGNSRLAAGDGWIRQVRPLDDDLDALSEALFSLRTSGGNEFCGQVLARAISDLAWHEGDHYRAIFIAGNEPFTQGSFAYADACRAAVAKGIVINTIHCGRAADGLAGGWLDGARLGGGSGLNIEQHLVEVAIAAPQDARLGQLNGEFNATYLAYGMDGAQAQARQGEQDANASSNGSFSARAGAKASGYYRNSAWDLVDAVQEKRIDPATIPRDELPEALRGLDAQALAQVIAAKAAERARLRAEMVALSAAREAFLAATQKEKAGAQPVGATFGGALRQALAGQMAAKGYRLR